MILEGRVNPVSLIQEVSMSIDNVLSKEYKGVKDATKAVAKILENFRNRYGMKGPVKTFERVSGNGVALKASKEDSQIALVFEPQDFDKAGKKRIRVTSYRLYLFIPKPGFKIMSTSDYFKPSYKRTVPGYAWAILGKWDGSAWQRSCYQGTGLFGEYRSKYFIFLLIYIMWKFAYVATVELSEPTPCSEI